MNLLKLNVKSILCLLFAAFLFASCSDDDLEPSVVDDDIDPTSPIPEEVKNFVDFESLEDQQYNLAMAEKDFGDMVDKNAYHENNAHIFDKSLRVTMPKETVSRGVLSKFWLNSGPSYEVTYDVKFHDSFDFAKGGKLGFGFNFGDGVAGQFPVGTVQNGKGGSARMMWNDVGNGVIKFKPYLYYMDMGSDYGNNVKSDAVYPKSGSLQPNTVYTIKMRVHSNTENNADGSVMFKVNGQKILEASNIKWANQENKHFVSQLSFETFRGGGDPSWYSYSDGYIYYDNITVTENPQEAF